MSFRPGPRRTTDKLNASARWYFEDCESLWEWIDYSVARGHAFPLPNADAVLSTGKDFVERAHARGVRIDVWTVDDPETIAELFAWGVDAVETNDPELAAPIRDRARFGTGQA